MVIIDYYNFLYLKYYDITENIILKNIYLLDLYALEYDITILLVFDGYRWKDLENFKKNRIRYFFSHNKTADEVIISCFSHLQGKSNILVTDDIKLKNTMKKKSSISYLSTRSFWERLDFFRNCTNTHLKKKKSNLIKTTDMNDDFIDELYKKYN